MAITIDRNQRDAMYQEVVLDLNGLTDLWTEFDAGNYDRAKELRQRFVFDMRLLDDLGWEPEPDADEFTLTMDGVDLAWVVSHLIEQTGAIIHTHIVEPIEPIEPIERTANAERSVKAQSVLGSILGHSPRARRQTSRPTA